MTNSISISAKPAAYKNNLVPRIVVVLLVAGFAYWRYGLVPTLIFLAIMAVVVSLVLWIPLQRRFSITDKKVVYKGLLGRTITMAFKDVTHALYATAYLEPNFGGVSRIVIADEKNKKLISLNGIYWDAEDLKKSAEVLKKNVTLKVIDNQITFTDLAKEYPSVMPYYERHPFALGLIIAGIIVAVLAVISFIITI